MQDATAWYQKATKPVTNPTEKVNLLLDLDNNVISRGIPNKRMSYLMALQNTADNSIRLFYIDEDAFRKIKAFVDNGHGLTIVSAATYSFITIKKIFSSQGIPLTEEQYICHQNFSPFDHTEKAFFIDARFHAGDSRFMESMLFDDRAENQPTSILFTQTYPDAPFPSLVRIKREAVIALQNAGINIVDSWRTLADNLQLQNAILALKEAGIEINGNWIKLVSNSDLQNGLAAAYNYLHTSPPHSFWLPPQGRHGAAQTKKFIHQLMAIATPNQQTITKEARQWVSGYGFFARASGFHPSSRRAFASNAGLLSDQQPPPNSPPALHRPG